MHQGASSGGKGQQENLDLEDTLRLLHAKDDDGKLHIGIDAFILIWRQLKRWRILAILVSLPVIKQLTNICYKIFANWRFKRISYCNIDYKNKENK
ncbi:DUF393 domain-containing protein [Francisellaceae bacterium CB299]